MILLTGATGSLGSSLVQRFVLDGSNLICLVRKKSDSIPADIKQVVGDLIDCNVSGCRATDRPLKDDVFVDFQSSLMATLGNTDVVVHAAARAHIIRDEVADPLEAYRKINRDATLALARLAAKAGVERFVFLSSIGVNGNQNIRPFLESDIPCPHDPYSVSKFEAEQRLLALAKETGMEVVIIRPPLVYGPNAPGNFGSLVNWVNKGLPLPFGSVNNQRSLVALDNLVDFVALCANSERSPKAANEVFLISDGVDVSTADLLRKVAKAHDVKLSLLPLPVGLMKFVAKLLGKSALTDRLFGNLQVDSSKARDLLGWQPVSTMEKQLEKIATLNVS